MTTHTLTATPHAEPRRTSRTNVPTKRIPLHRVVAVELRKSVDTRAGWFDMALSWLNGFFLFGEETSSPEPTSSTFEAATTTPTLSGGGYTVQSGACIDPAGRPRPCTDI